MRTLPVCQRAEWATSTRRVLALAQWPRSVVSTPPRTFTWGFGLVVRRRTCDRAAPGSNLDKLLCERSRGHPHERTPESHKAIIRSADTRTVHTHALHRLVGRTAGVRLSAAASDVRTTDGMRTEVGTQGTGSATAPSPGGGSPGARTPNVRRGRRKWTGVRTSAVP